MRSSEIGTEESPEDSEDEWRTAGHAASLLVIPPLLPRVLSRRRARLNVKEDLLVITIHRYAQLALHRRIAPRGGGGAAITRRVHGQRGCSGLARFDVLRPGVVHRPEKDDEDGCCAVTVKKRQSLARRTER